MAYSKLPKVCQDAPFGINGVNALDANVQAVRDLYDVEHRIPASGTIQIVGPGNTGPRAGEHDTPLVPRTVGIVSLASYTYGSGQSTWFVTVPVVGRMFLGITRLATGLFVLRTSSGSNVWCEGHAVGSSSAPRKLKIRPNTAALGVPGFSIQTLELVSGDWLPSDYSFHFALNAEAA